MTRPIANPFVGLRPFDRGDAHLFFGRDTQTDALMARLRTQRFVAVMGSSGSGKSSLVRAGLIPALEGGLLPGTSSAWSVAVMAPGANPIGNLAVALARAGIVGPRAGPMEGHLVTLEAILRRGALGLAEAVIESAPAPGAALLIVVDQFEELFRFKRIADSAGADDHAAAFVKLLLEAVRQPSPKVCVVLTMRSEFLGNCSEFRDLPEAINDGLFLIPRLTRDQLTEAITGPVAVVDGRIASSLVQRLLNDVGDDPDQLPVLQHALLRSWEHWQQEGAKPPGLTIEHYEAVKGLNGALSEHADEAFAELNPREQALAATAFRALTERGPDGREVRRPTSIRELADITRARPDQVVAVVDRFRREGRSLLVPAGSQPLEAGTVIDVSHESLMRKWTRLRDWIALEAEDRRIFLRLSDSAAQHAAGQEPLLQDPRLTFSSQWRQRFAPTESWARRYAPNFEQTVAFLAESQRAKQRAERARRARFAGLALLILTGVIGGLVWADRREHERVLREAAEQRVALLQEQAAIDIKLQALNAQQKAADLERELSEARITELQRQALDAQLKQRQLEELKLAQVETRRFSLAAAVEAARKDSRKTEMAALVAIQHLKLSLAGGTPLANRQERDSILRLLQVLPSMRLRDRLDGDVVTLASGDGVLTAGSLDRRPQVKMWRVTTDTPLPISGPPRATTDWGAVASSGARTVWTTNQTLHIWDAGAGERRSIDHASFSQADSIVLSPNGQLALVAQSVDAELWNLSKGAFQPLAAGRMPRVAFDGEGRVAATAGSGIVRLWSTETGQQLGTDLQLAYTEPVQRVALSARAGWVAVAASNRLELWQLTRDGSGTLSALKMNFKTQPHTLPLHDLVFSQDEARLATTADDGIAVFSLFRPPAGWSLMAQSRDTRARYIAFSPDGIYLAGGGTDGMARVWRVMGLPPLSEVFHVPHQASIRALAFLRNDVLATGDTDGVVRLSAVPTPIASGASNAEVLKLACQRVSRDLTASEWMAYFRLDLYTSACGRPLQAIEITLLGIAHATAGNADRAAETFKLLDGVVDTTGLGYEEVAYGAYSYAQQKQPVVAGALFRLSVRLAASIQDERTRADASHFVCRLGAVSDFAREVLRSCEDAVVLQPQNFSYRDSRGVAYALIGSGDLLSKASADFRFYAEHAKGARPAALVARRANWAALIDQEKNPFKFDKIRVLQELAKDLAAERGRLSGAGSVEKR